MGKEKETRREEEGRKEEGEEAGSERAREKTKRKEKKETCPSAFNIRAAKWCWLPQNAFF